MTAPAVAPQKSVRIALLALAILECLGALKGLGVLLGDGAELSGGGWGHAAVMAGLTAAPLLAFAALAFAMRGNLRFAIMAIAGIVLLTALSYLPSAMLHGLHQSGSGLYGLHAAAKLILFPLMALAAIALAARDQRLGLATILVWVPMLAGILSLVAFSLGVGLYGF